MIIISIISAVLLTVNSISQDNAHESKRTEDIQTLNNAESTLIQYMQMVNARTETIDISTDANFLTTDPATRIAMLKTQGFLNRITDVTHLSVQMTNAQFHWIESP